MTQEALRMALEFIERVNKDGWILADFEPEMYATITAIKEALAQPEQEPVAWKLPDKNVVFWEDTKEVDEYHGFEPTIPLYPHPQRTWVGLTNNDLQPIAEEYRILFGSWVHDFARAIEAKLKEKNT